MRKNREIKVIFAVLAVFFAGFLAVPVLSVLVKSFTGNGEAASLSHYVEVLTGRGFLKALGNSLVISVCSAAAATVLAFILAYTIHYTNVGKRYKWFISKAAILPMLLPTITYGFAIIYSFGKQGLLTKLFGRQLFDIYGFNGLLLGYVVYTLPVAFTLINTAMGYIDKRFMIVSRLMGDSPLQTFRMTIVIPLLGTLATSFIQTFFLCFTDFGIPASVGGQYEVVASVLYAEMLGSIPNFGNGAVVALVMIIPSVVSITVLHILEKYNVRYNRISPIELKKGVKRDVTFGVLSGVVILCALSMFAVMFVTPFIEEWPYRMSFTLEHVQAVFEDRQLYGVYVNSVIVALVTAFVGTLIAYGGALVTARSTVSGRLKKVRAGEVAIGFGLRQQAVADKADGLPIDYIDPAEGNFSLTESVAVIDKGEDANPLAMEMAQCIIENGREERQSYYPNALYNGESTDAANKSANPKVFPEKLTVDLLEQHQAVSEAAKEAAGL